MAKKLSKPRRELLEKLVRYCGSMPAERLSVPSRRLATQMQRDGLVQWKAPEISSRHTCLGQTLYVTDAGREAIGVS